MSLYKLTAEYLSLIDAMSYEDNELNQEEISKRLDAIEEAREDKINRCGWVVKNLEKSIETLKEKSDFFAEKAKRTERNLEKFKQYLTRCLQGEKTETADHEFKFRKSEETIITGEVPDQYCKIETKVIKTPDKKLIKQGIETKADIKFAFIKKNLNLTVK